MTSVERVKAICKERRIAISRLEKDLGFSNGYIGQLRKGVLPDDRLMMIADYLNVTTQFLMTGENNLDAAPTLTARDERDVEKILENTRNQLMNQEGLMFDGKPVRPEAIESILSAMRVGMEMAKEKNKQLYTPKKYKKD